MIRYLVGVVVIALVACSSPTAPVEVAATPEQSIRLSNSTSAPIYYFTIECDAAALANWAPCTDPSTCRHVQPGESRLIPYSEIGLYTPAADAALVYWWHLKPQSGGTFAPDSIRAIRVALRPGA
jgi:hypothetical protein